MVFVKKAWLTNPWVIIASIFLGLVIGFNDPLLAKKLSALGRLYLSLMGMCILPIMITAILSSFGKLLRASYIADMLKRLTGFLVMGLLVTAIFGVLAALITKPGLMINAQAKQLLSEKIIDTQMTAAGCSDCQNFMDFLTGMVPTNIFHALSQGNNLAVLFFSILLGVALGLVPLASAEKTLENLHVFYLALLKMVDWIMCGLPIGLCFLFTGYATQIKWSELTALANLVILIYASGLLLLIVCSLVIWRNSKLTYFKSIAVLKTPLLIGFGTCSSFAAIPTMIQSLEKNLHIERNLVELIIPLGVNLFRPASILRLAIVSIFVAQLYGQHLTLIQLAMVVVTSVLAGIAASGVPGIASVSVLAYVLQPLGLPTALGTVLLITITPIIDPILTLLNVYSTCTLGVLMKKKGKIQNYNERAS
ncbi:MAG: sodium:dicarboxylate symporter [Gammaproteobacteria bacterium]|jgi:proton glutamate symport protein|nr:sodium:dicarboxylate symporter [Gammaproteobacteria bacterium]